MNLRRRSNGIWTIRYRDELGNRREISTGTRDRGVAEVEAERIMRGQHPTRKTRRMSLETALWDTYDRVWSRQKSAHEKRYMVASLARSQLGTLEVDAVTYPVLSAFAEGLLEAGKAPATVNRKLATISKALGECVKLGLIPAVPPMPHQIERNSKVRWVTRDEEAVLLHHCELTFPAPDAVAMRNLIVFLVDTGARLSEALRVRQSFWDKATQVTFLDTKNGKSRTVPLTPRALEGLKGLPDWSKDKCVRLFTRVRNAAGLPDVSLHILRHTCASRLVQGGMDLYRVKEWLGHSTIQVTERYAHLAPSSLGQGADILGQGGAVGPQADTSGTHQRSAPHLSVVK